MNKKLILLVAVVLVSFVGTTNAQVAVYDYQTGSIVFNDLTGEIGLSIFAPEDRLNKGSASDLTGGTPAADVGLDGSITWANFGGYNGSGIEAGNIIVPGTDPNLITFELQLDFFSRGPGTVEVVNIPEPTSLILGGLGLIGFVAARRRS